VAIEGPGFAGNVAVADEGAQVFGGSASRWPIVGTGLVCLGRIDSPQAISHAIDPERITINHADGLGKGWEGRKQEGSGQDGHFHPFWLARDYGENAAGRLLHPPGSTEVGKIVMRAAAERIVPVSLELGGKSPSIVYPDADQDWAVDGIIAAMRFTRQSQSCTAGSRLFLHEDIFDSFLGKLEKRTTALRIGDPLDEKTDIGTIINNKQFTKVCKYVDEGLKRSDAKLVFGGLPPKTGPLSEGYYALPTVFADRSNDWRLAREEIFGPVLVAIRWSDEAEAIRMANDSHYGLAAYVWTHDIGAGLRTAHAIESGWVQVNQGGGQVPGMSYGGYKQSGIGREFSLEGMLDSFTQRKSVTVNLAV
jgi:acyl-CoA reductase-like NAD-dependent aldehyde dehydrogenase